MADAGNNYSHKHKHLEMIQAIINRMGSNSFVFKGWSITIIAGISAFAAKDSNQELIIVPITATLLFWAVDASYLMLERQFRKLYKDVAIKQEQDVDFLMTVTPTFEEWVKTFFRPILVAFYGAVLLMLIILLAILNNVSVRITYGA